ncbi:MAG: RsmB/NOP family class I SAM-dependent RNA methyltransferase [Acidobacteriota bacterium]
MSTSADRLKAAALLVRVEDGAFASRLLGDVSAPGVRARVLGALRLLRPLDGAIEAASRRKPRSLDPEVRAALRVGLYEIKGLGIPAAVAGDGAVRLIRSLGRPKASGLVNAVMRRAPGHWDRLVREGDDAFRNSHPDWLWRRWTRAFGRDAAEGAMSAAQHPAPLWVWFTDVDAADRLIGEGIELLEHPWMPGAWRAVGSDLVGSLRCGDAYAQDPASQLVAWLTVALNPGGGEVIDLCAAPGGKTARIVRDGPWAAAVGADLSLGRLRLAGRVFETCGRRVFRVVQDAARPAVISARWAAVVLDAPCSGTGTLRRHPELRYRLRPEDVDGRASLQAKLLEGALDLVAPGGHLLYSTCSVEPEENEGHFERTPLGFEVVDLAPSLPAGTPAITTSAGGIRLLPQESCDGFTVHALRRT